MSKAVLITGASSGIGKALAYEYAARGANLGLLARRVDVLNELAEDLQRLYPGIKVVCESLDVGQFDAVLPALTSVSERLGGVDCVIANAGVTAVNKTGAGDFAKDLNVININLLGAMATVDAAARLFRESGAGKIVGISSLAAFRGIPGSAAYSASKAGLSHYLDAVRIELKKHKIEVVAVHPGFIKTDLAPNMEKYPFVVTAEKAAREIISGVEKGASNIIVPSMPWSLIGRMMPMLPDRVVEKVF